MKAELLVDAGCELGEGVQWDPVTARVWWTDIQGCALWSCDADGGDVTRIATAERLGSFAFDPDGRLLAAFASGLFRWDIARDRLERLTAFEPDHPTSRMNDGRCDRQGRFVVGGIDEDGLKPTSSVIRYDGAARTLFGNVGCANSICFSRDGRQMYFADTPRGEILRYPYDPDTGALGTATLFHRVPKGTGAPDGSCIDAEDALWSTRFDGARVQRILLDGTEDICVTVDAPNVTCACFGGPALDRLFITTARMTMGRAALVRHPQSGGLFVAEPGVTGLRETRYAHRLFAD